MLSSTNCDDGRRSFSFSFFFVFFNRLLRGLISRLMSQSYHSRSTIFHRWRFIVFQKCHAIHQKLSWVRAFGLHFFRFANDDQCIFSTHSLYRDSAVYQTDGNFVVYSRTGGVKWASGTNAGRSLSFQTDGNSECNNFV